MGKSKGQFLGSKSKTIFQTLLSTLLIFQITFGPNILFAADSGETRSREYSVFLPHEIQDMAAEDFLKSDSQFSENEKAVIEKYFNEPARLTLDLFILTRALLEKADSIPTAAEDIRSRESDREISVELPGIGKAEFNSLGARSEGKIFTRFVHYKTQTSYVAIDRKFIEKYSTQDLVLLGATEKDAERAILEARGQLDRYVAIQQLHTKVHPEEYIPFPELHNVSEEEARAHLNELVESAKAKPKKRYDNGLKVNAGRLVKILVYDSETQIQHSLTEYQRASDLKPMDRVKIYWRSIKQGTRLNWEYWDNGKFYEKPLTFFTGDVLVGLFSAVAQTGVFLSLKGFNADPFSIIMVAGWAFAFSITPTFRNWINVNPSRSSIIFKSFLNSMAFNYVMLVAIHGADVVFSLTPTAFNLAFLSVTNAIINNFGKVWWYKVPQMRERAGLNLKQINIGNFRTKVDQSSIEQQAWYLGSNIFRMADLVAMGTLFNIMMIDFTYSRLAMLITLPVVHYSIMRYAMAKDFKEKEILKKDWIKYNYLHWNGKPVEIHGHKIPILYLGSLEMMAKESWMIAKNSAMMVYWLGRVIYDAINTTMSALLNKYATLNEAERQRINGISRAPSRRAMNMCARLFN